MYDQVSHLEVDSTPETWTAAPCPHCGSRDIASELRGNLNAKLNPLDISFTAFAPFWGAEKPYADPSLGCKEIIRAFVKNTNRQWIQKSAINEVVQWAVFCPSLYRSIGTSGSIEAWE
jgi:hypothetical protein